MSIQITGIQKRDSAERVPQSPNIRMIGSALFSVIELNSFPEYSAFHMMANMPLLP